MRSVWSVFFSAILVCELNAQGTTHTDTSTIIRFSAYTEVYYGYDFTQPANNERPAYLYNHKRHNEVNANLLMLRAEYERDGIRGAAGLMAGNYAQYNLAHEPPMLRHIYEARVGMRLSKRRELWVDAGLFPSHIGFETVIGIDNHTLTRSIVAENSPYYEAGVMLSYHPSDRWMIAGLVLNGWQRIQRPMGHTRPAFGTQVKFDDGEGRVLNWSTFAGWVGHDALDLWRVYNNLYGTVQGERSAITLGFDMGVQRALPSIGPRDEIHGWFTVVAVASQEVFNKWWLNGRMEYFLDDGAIILPYNTVIGGSIGVDHRPNDGAMWRIEGRLLGSNVNLFGPTARTNVAIVSALCLKL